jgi:hypothetical protein
MYEYTNKHGEVGKAIADVVSSDMLADELKEQLDYIAQFKLAAWDNRKVSNVYSKGHTYGNLGEGQKLVAKIPAQLLRAALWMNPNLLKDDKAWNEFLGTLPPVCDFRK